MNAPNFQARLDNIINEAKKAPKGDYHRYEMYKRRIETLHLSPAEYEDAVKRLSKALRV